ncbi:hypothetical protein [Rhodococcoides yunnanense]|uniref:hypothetical protein n=1 Tax=Rhodococcoides yunnanense TaxID=278209 RepID=UPI000932E9EB|nr:hypothetical protein [Rhodococcus yunnanensis]
MSTLASSPLKNACRAAVVGLAAVGTMLASTTVADASTANLTPIVTLGHGLSSDQIAPCIGYIDVQAASDYPAPYPPNYVRFTTHFIGIAQACSVSGTIEWRNLDTGESGSRQWAVSGWDGPSAPTFASIEPGAGRVSLNITTTMPHIPGRGQFTAA